MRAVYTGHVSQNEWRWVILLSTLLILLSMLPFMLAAGISSSQEGLQFMGVLHRHTDGAAALAHMQDATQGGLSTIYLHTPESQRGMLLELLYTLLGYLARTASLDTIVVFHVARLGAALMMYLSIYTLGASIWTRIRARRLFFLFAVLGGGLGWILAPLTGRSDFVDLWVTGLFPYQATLYSVSIPLTIAALALLTGAVIGALNVGKTERPKVTNQGLMVFVIGLLITLVYPVAFLPVMIAFFGLLIAHTFTNRKIAERDFWWMMWFAVPAAPVLVYNLAASFYNPVSSAVWAQSNTIVPPPLDGFVIGLLIPLVLALPGLWRAVRRFEPDGNQFMLGWLAVMLALIYLTPLVRLNFGVGLMLPIAYFVTRAIEDFWLERVKRPGRYRIFAVLLPLMAASHMLVTFWPVQHGVFTRASAFVLPTDYARAFRWIGMASAQDAVILTAPEAGVWAPAWSGRQTVYGSLRYTLDAAQKARVARAWYSADNADTFPCTRLLDGAYHAGAPYRVRYVVVGPLERQYGGLACLDAVQRLAIFGEVEVYRYVPGVSGGGQ